MIVFFKRINLFYFIFLFSQLPIQADDSFYSNPIRYRAQFTFTVLNDSCDIEQLEVWLPKILEWANQKEVKILQITPQYNIDTTDSEDKCGIYYWKFKKLPYRGNSIKMSIDFSFTSYQTNFEVDLNLVGGYDRHSQLFKEFTKPEAYIECDRQEIKGLAVRIVSKENNPYLQARKIFDWILDNMEYQFVPGLKGALYAFQNRHGECGDYAALFVALCRASGIPARPVVGMWANPFNEPHVWSEFYLPNYGWLPVDPSQADGWGDADAYFGRLDNRRVIFSKGYNVTLIPEIQIKSMPIFQLGAWWYEGNKTGAHEEISLSIQAEKVCKKNIKTFYRNDSYNLELSLPDGWEITSVGGRGKYVLGIEIWIDSRDCRVYLYGREWKPSEIRRTPEEITHKDIEYFSYNSSRFILLHQGPENFRYLSGNGFLAITSSYGIGDFYVRYIYFTDEDLIFWLIFQSTEENYMDNYPKFIELANNLRLINSRVH